MNKDEIIEKTLLERGNFTKKLQKDGEHRLNDYVVPDVLACVEAVKQSEWVPCGERLPENNVFVLVYLKSGYFEILQRSEYEYPNDKPTAIWEKLCCNGYFTDWDILAWQPLPQPPSEVQSD